MEGGAVLTALRASSFGENRTLAASNECVAAHTQDLPEDTLRDVCACQKTAALSASFASSKCSAAASHPVNHRKVPLLNRAGKWDSPACKNRYPTPNLAESKSQPQTTDTNQTEVFLLRTPQVQRTHYTQLRTSNYLGRNEDFQRGTCAPSFSYLMAKAMEVKKIGLIFQESHVERKKSMEPWY